MPWQSIRGHDEIADCFRRALARGRLASTFLFVGPGGIGKRAFALKLAQALLCERVPEERLDPCGQCPSCHQVLARTHPDVEVISRPADKAFIPVELLIGDAEHRMRAGLCYNLALKPYSGRRKVAIIDDADYLNKEGANCLLKTLEEPPPKSILILIGASEQRQLPTIRSRCQVVRFQPLPADDVAQLLIEKGLCDDPALAKQAAARSGGSLERAYQLCQPQLLDFHRELIGMLSDSERNQLQAVKTITQFVDEAGKESAAKRARMRLIVSLAEEFYRALLLSFTSGQSPADTELAEAIISAREWFAGDDAAVACLQVCLDAYSHIDANANQATLIEWWLDELANASRLGTVAV
jgi:DNA polymerase-3 subunit delta'